MKAADTNVLVRYVTNDDPKQADAVEHFLQCRSVGEPVFVPTLVVCELVWVLDRVYSQTRTQIAATLELILEDGLFEFEHEAVARHCLELYGSGKAGFSDYLIGETSRESGCRDTVTFDRALRSAPGFTLLR